MNLNDNEILELSELCNAVVDGTLTDQQRARLSNWLLQSEEARRYYVRTLGLSASLHTYASEMQAEAPDALETKLLPFPQWLTWAAGIAAAAAIVLSVWILRSPKPASSAAEPVAEFVARVTGSKDAQWADPRLAAGVRVHKGERLELLKGFAEVTFDSGAQVVLEGPSSLDVNSAWDGTLRKGGLRAYVPKEAIGFRVSHPTVEVLDLGTEFTMIADSSAADVTVLKGEVEAAPRDQGDDDSILLQATESRRFANSGVSEVKGADRAYSQLTGPVAFDRFAPAVHYVHWLFDEPVGNLFKAQLAGVAAGDYDLRLLGTTPHPESQAHAEGHSQHAVHFDGHSYGEAAFPGISGNAAHTVAFWVKVPTDAPLSDAYAMVAWGTTSKKLSSHPVHITWNRNPEEGQIGALRTDFGGGSAIGTTSLRDGRWHHVAVIFAPGEDPSIPVQVKQYVDGKLESSATNPPGRTVRISPSKVETPAKLDDVVYLGCRLGMNGIKNDRFKGEIDELFITDRSLEPNEIVQVMKENRLVPAAVQVASAVAIPGFDL